MEGGAIFPSIVENKFTEKLDHEEEEEEPLPRIVLRDRNGRVLATDTIYQRAIAAARQKMAKVGSHADTPFEWQLPHMAPPARPDYTRLGKDGPVRYNNLFKKSHTTLAEHTEKVGLEAVKAEIASHATDLTKEQMLQLLRETTQLNQWFKKLTQEFQTPGSHLEENMTFLPIMPQAQQNSEMPAVTHSVDESNLKREETSFYYGARKTLPALCYGCERGPGPHFHRDKAIRTGGGFTYFQRDKPKETVGQNPLEWAHEDGKAKTDIGLRRGRPNKKAVQSKQEPHKRRRKIVEVPSASGSQSLNRLRVSGPNGHKRDQGAIHDLALNRPGAAGRSTRLPLLVVPLGASDSYSAWRQKLDNADYSESPFQGTAEDGRVISHGAYDDRTGSISLALPSGFASAISFSRTRPQSDDFTHKGDLELSPDEGLARDNSPSQGDREKRRVMFEGSDALRANWENTPTPTGVSKGPEYQSSLKRSQKKQATLDSIDLADGEADDGSRQLTGATSYDGADESGSGEPRDTRFADTPIQIAAGSDGSSEDDDDERHAARRRFLERLEGRDSEIPAEVVSGMASRMSVTTPRYTPMTPLPPPPRNMILEKLQQQSALLTQLQGARADMEELTQMLAEDEGNAELKQELERRQEQMSELQGDAAAVKESIIEQLKEEKAVKLADTVKQVGVRSADPEVDKREDEDSSENKRLQSQPDPEPHDRTTCKIVKCDKCTGTSDDDNAAALALTTAMAEAASAAMETKKEPAPSYEGVEIGMSLADEPADSSENLSSLVTVTGIEIPPADEVAIGDGAENEYEALLAAMMGGPTVDDSGFTGDLGEERKKEKLYQVENKELLEQIEQLKKSVALTRQEDESVGEPAPATATTRDGVKSPAAFKLKKTEKKSTSSEDPFSKDRDLKKTVKAFVPKKSDKPPTDFIDFEHREVDYKPPKKFELKKLEHNPPEPAKQVTVETRPRPTAPPAFIEPPPPPPKEPTSAPPTEPTPLPPKEATPPPPVEKVNIQTPPPPTPPPPQVQPEPETVVAEKPKKEPKPKKNATKERPPLKERPKKEAPPPPTPPPKEPTKKGKTQPPPPPPPPKEPTPIPRETTPAREPTPIVEVRTPEPEKEMSFVFTKEPEPEIVFANEEEEQDEEEEVAPTVVVEEAAPVVEEAAKKLPRKDQSKQLNSKMNDDADLAFRLQEALRMRLKNPPKRKVSPPPETPEEGGVALDYLDKYCIIHPARLPIYERIFKDVVSKQQYRYLQLSDVEIPDNLIHAGDHHLTHKDKVCVKPVLGTSIVDHQVDKVRHIVGQLQRERTMLDQASAAWRREKTEVMWDIVQSDFRSVLDPKKKKEKGKKGKRGKKSAASAAGEDQPVTALASAAGSTRSHTLLPANEMETQTEKSPEEIMSELPSKILNQVEARSEVVTLDVKLSRATEKMSEIEERLTTLGTEKTSLELAGRGLYHKGETAEAKPREFERAQSARWRALNPIPDMQMNLPDFSEALQQVNSNMMTEQEAEFISIALDLPSRHRINVKLFSAIAALSEKIIQLEPWLRKLLVKVDMEALAWKMTKVQDLWNLCVGEGNSYPDGSISTMAFRIELAAGGLKPELVDFVCEKFDREQNGMVTFLDFLIFVPLFVELHGRICDDPFGGDGDFDF